MPKPVKKKRPSSDPNRRAHQLFGEHMAKMENSPKWKGGDTAPASAPASPRPSAEQIRQVMAELGRRGGKVSGAKRMEMPKKKRIAIARQGGLARAAKRRPAQS